jgi:hypothetical protein
VSYSKGQKAKSGQSSTDKVQRIKKKIIKKIKKIKKIPVGAKFSAPLQTGPEAHLASYTVGTGSLSGSKVALRLKKE